MNNQKLITVLCCFLAVVITWYINHEEGYGPIVANGLVGIAAAIILTGPLAGATYAASFCGMSSIIVMPNIGVAALCGIIIGVLFAYTKEVFAGIGGKGGTVAAASVLITLGILRIFS